MNIIDSSCWLEYFAGTPLADVIGNIVENTDDLLVPSIVLFEVFKKLMVEVGEDKAIMAIAHLKQGHIVELDGDSAIFSAKIGREYNLALADSIIYATTLKYNATLYTQDHHFEKLRNVIYYKKKIS